MKLIVGLGNPGSGYAGNRHNIGYMCLSYFAREHGISLDRKQGLCRTGTGSLAGQEVVVARSQTYMNQSGEAVAPLVRKLKIGPEDLVVIHDDLDLPLGRIRLRLDGSAGGHKGIGSLAAHLGTRDFIRVKVGIGRPVVESDENKEERVIAYVLSDFAPEETAVVREVLPRVNEALVNLVAGDLAAAMNKFNQPSPSP
ncbi:MAG: aminoacyl-tRNA hydrolase [Chloroflexi bacterium]|nr:aminoacyl-tRNA hydrolase [Chloroflexota bacterium]